MGIGELAARTGPPVKTIRYYSDIGLLPESGRAEAATAGTPRTGCPGSD
ncbi:MerR family DNA-binding transcriptional regulator [Streptomyces sp. NPDC057748]